MAYPNGYELYKRVDDPNRKERYDIIAEFPEKPTLVEINDAFTGRRRYSFISSKKRYMISPNSIYLPF